MKKFTSLTSRALPLIRDNIDTDVIIPSREMKTVSKVGLAAGLFAGWRYRDTATRDPDPDFVLNDPAYTNAQILLGGANFGCGSSREHAAWALAEYGFRVIIAPSFNPIFRGNCVRNGILPIVLDPRPIAAAGEPVSIDLAPQEIRFAGKTLKFEIDSESKTMLLGGLDAIDLTLHHWPDIQAFREADRLRRPWVYL